MAAPWVCDPAADGSGGVRPIGARMASALMGVAAVAAALSAVFALVDLGAVDAQTAVVATWRAYGLVVFAGLFALLAWRPLSYPGVWELVIFHKVALTLTALVYAAGEGVADTGTILLWDGALSVVLVLAYLSCRGWSSWRRPHHHGASTSSS